MKSFGRCVLLPVTYWGGSRIYLSCVRMRLVNNGHYPVHMYVNGEEQNDSNLVQVGCFRSFEKLLIYDPARCFMFETAVTVYVGINGAIYDSEGFWVVAEYYSVKDYVVDYNRGSLSINEF